LPEVLKNPNIYLQNVRYDQKKREQRVMLNQLITELKDKPNLVMEKRKRIINVKKRQNYKNKKYKFTKK